jgi:hypothetical protein
MRLSRNLAYMLAQYKHGTKNCTVEKFERAAKASFQHHWNDHQLFGSWCQARDWSEEEKVKNKNKIRDKEKNEGVRATARNPKEIYRDRLHEKGLPRVLDSQDRTDSLPRHKCLSFKEIILLPHHMWESKNVSIDSLGYCEYNRQLYLELGLKMSSITNAFYKQQDKCRATDQVCANKPDRRKLRAQQRLANINKEWQKEVIDKQNGNTYQSAMMAPSVAAPSSSETPRSSEGPVGNGRMDNEGDGPFCKACKNYGHQGRCSRLSPKNKKSQYYEG